MQFSLSELTKRNPLFPAHLRHLTFVGGDQFNQSWKAVFEKEDKSWQEKAL